jgi:hypothetical protein
MNYGGIVTSLETITDIVRGFDPLDGYRANPGPFFAALIGRYADRIGQARFAPAKVLYQLDKNDGENTLDGGPRGFDQRFWTPRAPGSGHDLGHRLRLNADHFNPLQRSALPLPALKWDPAPALHSPRRDGLGFQIPTGGRAQFGRGDQVGVHRLKGGGGGGIRPGI